jgi:hypothetical protein
MIGLTDCDRALRLFPLARKSHYPQKPGFAPLQATPSTLYPMVAGHLFLR